jgi:hypothetical protein
MDFGEKPTRGLEPAQDRSFVRPADLRGLMAGPKLPACFG